MRTTLHLRFPGIRNVLLKHFSRITDHREREKVDHELKDVCMSALAMFCYQDPSLLQFMHRVKAEKMAANLTHIWAIDSVPSDSQMRVVMDEIDPKEFESLFTVFFRLLQRGKHVEQYRVLGNYYLCAIDGSGYFSSDHIGCPSCLRRKVKKKQGDTLQFSHQIVQAALVHPKLSQVIPLAPEQVKNTDGSEKQDCETNAAKRLLGKIKKAHPKLPLIIVGDGLYSKQPMIESTTSSGMHYVFTVHAARHGNGVELGVEFLQAAPQTVVIVMTGTILPPEEEALCEEHNFPVLRKPFLASDVINQIRSRLAAAASSGLNRDQKQNGRRQFPKQPPVAYQLTSCGWLPASAGKPTVKSAESATEMRD